MFQVVLQEGYFAYLMDGEHPFDQHLGQVIERLGRLNVEQCRRQCVAFARQHVPHPGGIERFRFSGELLDLARRNTSKEVWSAESERM